jgi:hypothetical protein
MSDEVKAEDLKSKTKATLVELLVRQHTKVQTALKEANEKLRG